MDFSREQFDIIWPLVKAAQKDTLDRCDPEFINKCGLSARPDEVLRPNFERAANRLYAELIRECYDTNEGNQMPDARKVSAVICAALIEAKVFVIDEKGAVDFVSERNAATGQDIEKRVKLNQWIVRNIFANYKTAYFAGLRFVYRDLLAQLIEEDNDEALRALNDMGHLSDYPSMDVLDSFHVSMILGLGRADLRGLPVNVFLLAMQFFQIEMYTRKSLECQILEQRAEQPCEQK